MKRLLLFFILSAMIAGCSGIKATYDIDKSVDFTKFKTYAFSEETLKLGIQELDRDRILRAVDREMTARGFTKSDSPDAIIDILIKLQERKTATATNTGGGMYGYGRYGYGGGFSTTQINVNEYVDGTIFVNFVDKSVEKIVWQGRGTKTLDESASGEKKEKNINAGMKMIFSHFPVKPSTASK
jgi:hypothetical protein